MENLVMMMSHSFWSGKRVLLTGHTGFKGSWLAIWLTRLGARVTGVSLPPTTTPNLFSLAQVGELVDSRYTDIRDAEKLSRIVRESTPEIIFHLAAQPLVRASYRSPLDTFSTNVMGTANLLDALRRCSSVRVAVLVTTDKVYRNQEWPYPYRENDILGGHDPYSASKAASEIVAACYRDAFLDEAGIAICTARAGNVLGGGDWSEDRLIPDAVRAWEAHRPLEIRRPLSVRPWQHVLEPLACYCLLAEKIWETPHLSGAYNFGPEPGTAATVRTVIEQARSYYEGGEVIWGEGDTGPHETNTLTLEIAKARAILGIAPRWSLPEAIRHTMTWYSNQRKGQDARQLCLAQIAEYEV